MTPVSRAAHVGNAELLRALLGHDAKVDLIFGDGGSVLHSTTANTEVFGVLLNHRRSTMTETRFGSFLLHADEFGMIALQYIDSVEIAKLLVEPPGTVIGSFLQSVTHN